MVSPARRRVVMVAALLLLGLAAVPSARAAADPSLKLKVVRATADASVRSDRPRARSGKATSLRIDGDKAARGYVRFKLTGLTNRVVRAATIWVYRTSTKASYSGLTARRVDVLDGPRFAERTVAWYKRPPVLTPTGTAVKASGQRWVKIDVLPLVRQNGTVDIALTTAKRSGLFVASREAGAAKAPRLHLQ